jgi:hypothetical protein
MRIRHITAVAALALAATGSGIAAAESTPLRAPAGPSGLVIAHEPGMIIVVPWERGRAVRIQVTYEQARACPALADYKICLSGGR